MHEQAIIKALLRDLATLGAKESAVIEVGDLANISADHLLEHMRDHTDLQLTISQGRSTIKCNACSYVGAPKILARTHDLVLSCCPECESDVEVLGGDKIIIKKVG